MQSGCHDHFYSCCRSQLLKKACLLIFLIGFFGTASAEEHHFLVLNYHDIVGAEGAKPPFNSMDVSVDHLEEHLGWLKKNGYKIVSVQNILDAAAGKDALPDKAVLLTFDDGYQSFYTRVFPLLKKYHYPATVALVGTWMDGNVTADEPGKPLLSLGAGERDGAVRFGRSRLAQLRPA